MTEEEQQQQHDQAAQELAERAAKFCAQGYSEEAARALARRELSEEAHEDWERLERERKERERHQLIEWYEQGEMRRCPGSWPCDAHLHAPENVIPDHETYGAFGQPHLCDGSGAIVTEPEPLPDFLR